jgi:hypothetical protein
MEKTTTIDDVLEIHHPVLETYEGQHAFCNIVDYISAAYLSLQNPTKILQKMLAATKNINENANEIAFTPSLIFDACTKEQRKESQKFKADASKNSKSGFQLYEKNAKKKFEFIVPKEYPDVVFTSYSCLKKSREMSLPFINEIISTDSIKNSFEKCPKLGLNFLLLFGLEIITKEPMYKFPYECDCAESHINHLDNVCQKSFCIKQTSNLFFLSKQKFYHDKTLAMITDLLKEIDFYKELFYFQQVTHMEFIQKTICHFYFDIKCTENYIASYNQIKNTIIEKSDLISTLQSHYKIFYNELASFGKDATRRSPLIFGPLKNIDPTILSEPQNIFTDFIKTDNINELPLSLSSEADQAYEKLLSEYNAEKNNRTTFQKKNLKKKKTFSKEDRSNKNNTKKNMQEKRIILSENTINPIAPSSKKDLLENTITKYKLFYLTNYLKECLESNDQYHTFPYIIDILTLLYGIERKDLKDKTAMTHFWPIAVTDEAHENTKYFVYKVVQNKKDGYIFHRGPLKLKNVNLLLQFQDNPTVFDTILNDASLLENPIVQNIINDNMPETVDPLEYCEIDDDQSIINNNFMGLFGSNIVEVNERYLVILALLSNKIIYFPLIM